MASPLFASRLQAPILWEHMACPAPQSRQTRPVCAQFISKAQYSQSRHAVAAASRGQQEAPSTAPAPAAALPVAPLHLAQRLMALDAAPTASTYLLIALLAAADPAGAAMQHAAAHHPHVIADLAENEEFWGNVGRYISYFFSVLLGTAYVAIKPVIALLKRPTTAVLVIAGGAVLYFFVSTTVSAMLGMNDIIDYEPSSIVTPQQ